MASKDSKYVGDIENLVTEIVINEGWDYERAVEEIRRAVDDLYGPRSGFAVSDSGHYLIPDGVTPGHYAQGVDDTFISETP